jgi:Flp pilus assembly protein TadG
VIARLRRLRGDTRAVTVVEFAIVTPVLMLLLLGLFDLLYQRYVQTVLDGAVIKAGRDSSLEVSSSENAGKKLDAAVQKVVATVAADATIRSERRSYATFAAMKPEPFRDANGDGLRQRGECYDDINGNGRWDADPGIKSQGGANDVTRYTVWITYPRLFAASAIVGGEKTNTVSSSTILKNQPYRVQQRIEVKSICT